MDKKQIRIELLTPVHIGSGQFLQQQTDYVEYVGEGGRYFGVIDDHKLLHILGEDRIDLWVQSVERDEDTTELVKRFAPSVAVPKYCKRSIFICSDERTNTLKECLHDGMGRPYIPGSSIKGAIRTAILSLIMQKKTPEEISNMNMVADGKCAQIEKEQFGDIQQSDFRFLQVGDAYFERECEVALYMCNLNIRERESLFDKSKAQMIEAIAADCESNFSLKLIENPKDNKMPKSLPKSIKELFALINSHTKNLLESEIDIWESEMQDEAQWTDKDIDWKNAYLEYVSEILQTAKECKENECVMRIGHTSGWRFITGAWTERMDDFDDHIPRKARPHNENYEDFIFPKSRRIDDSGGPLGFVKLSF